MEVTNLSFIMIDWCLTPALAVFQQYHDAAWSFHMRITQLVSVQELDYKFLSKQII
jgi:hypothetical protein